MAVPQGYGVSNADGKYIQSRSRNRSGSTADLLDSEGKIVDQVVHSVAEETQEEVFTDTPDTLLNTVTAGQHGKTVVTGVQVTESNTDWTKGTVTKRTLPDYAGDDSGSGD